MKYRLVAWKQHYLLYMLVCVIFPVIQEDSCAARFTKYTLNP